MTCQLKTLAETAVDRVDLLKIDVERAELDVLKGIAEPDWTSLRQLAIEVHDEDGRLEAIAEMLGQRGFAVVPDQDEAIRNTPVRMLFATRR